ncbi:hypothetical protein WH47_04515 [Habropoda laboriosa]|uniref:Uncharacterized protein n=1 Tax=Habropoda laboriosa TaxID=597456 RepID=A0A0L7R2C9_9HYME|nr:hypothetical protein WH47_04515 [Habropoda laboriosa]
MWRPAVVQKQTFVAQMTNTVYGVRASKAIFEETVLVCLTLVWTTGYPGAHFYIFFRNFNCP